MEREREHLIYVSMYLGLMGWEGFWPINKPILAVIVLSGRVSQGKEHQVCSDCVHDWGSG